METPRVYWEMQKISLLSKIYLDIFCNFIWKAGSYVYTIDYECLFNLITYGLKWNWNFLDTESVFEIFKIYLLYEMYSK